mgnify:CR=1 FL=1
MSAARQHTLTHAKAIGALEHQAAPPAKVVITGMDGSLIPIVESGAGKDKRKDKTLGWKQANLCCARSAKAPGERWPAEPGSDPPALSMR